MSEDRITPPLDTYPRCACGCGATARCPQCGACASIPHGVGCLEPTPVSHPLTEETADAYTL